jgi:amino acid transporter
MEKLFQLILEVVLALLFIWFARTRGPQREPFIYSIGLIIAALFYVAFSVTGATTQWFMLELIGLVVFTIFAVLGLRVSLWFLALGWASHVSWDVLLHLIREQPFVPNWYPVACISFDLMVAGSIVAQLREQDT